MNQVDRYSHFPLLFSLVVIGSLVLIGIGPCNPVTPGTMHVDHRALVEIATGESLIDSGIRLNDAGREAAEYLAERYEEAGLMNVRFEEFETTRWWPETYGVTVVGDAGEMDLNAFPVWYCGSANNLELEVVYAGFGTGREFPNVAGKAVLIDMKRILHFTPTWMPLQAQNQALARGAAAIIFTDTRVDAPSGMAVSSFTGAPFPIPVFSIGKTDGEALKAMLQGGPVRVRINLDYTLSETEASNVVGELPGNGEIDEYIIVGGHYDTWFQGASDNLGSQASILGMAENFAQVPQEYRKRNIIFVSLFGHEYGNMGHNAFVEQHAQELERKVTCFLDIDGSGSWGWEEVDDTGEIQSTGLQDKAGIFTSSYALAALAHEAIYSYAVGNAKGPWFLMDINTVAADLAGAISQAGWPNLMLINKHIYYHSEFDTLDRITPTQVYARTLMNEEIIGKLLDSEPGYYIGVDTNPFRVFAEGEEPLPDLTANDLPRNPKPWVKGPPQRLSFHVIPHNPKVGSPVIAWVAFAEPEGILLEDNISWILGGVAGSAPVKGATVNTAYLTPGTKTITMTVTDKDGRSTTVSREIEVTP